MEIKITFLVYITFLVVSEVIGIPLALRSPLKDRKVGRPWRELNFHSEEDYGRDASVSSSDTNLISSSLSRKAIKYPDDNQETDNHVTDRNSIPSTSDGTASEPRLDRFYRHRTPTRNRELGIIVFPKDDDEPMKEKDTADSSDDLKLGQRSEDAILSNDSMEVSASRQTKGESDTQIETLGHYVRQAFFNMGETTEIANVEHSTTQQSSGNEELNVREQSLYTGPTLKTTENSGCPDGFKKTRNGSCQKPSRRLMQTG